MRGGGWGGGRCGGQAGWEGAREVLEMRLLLAVVRHLVPHEMLQLHVAPDQRLLLGCEWQPVRLRRTHHTAWVCGGYIY